jgi:2-aminoadipate transaminase
MTESNENIMYGQYIVPHSSELCKFNVGQPSPLILPLEIFKIGINYTMSLMDPSVLQYGNIPGYNKFRKCFSKFLIDQYKINVDFNHLFMTNGITHGITLICSLFMQTGSTIYVEEPTYFLALNIFKELGLNIVSIPIEKDGININKLEDEIKKNGDLTNHMLYTIPTFHNPTSYTMSEKKRLLWQMKFIRCFILMKLINHVIHYAIIQIRQFH